MTDNIYPCPCCGYLVHDELPDSYNICPICFWEDDIAQLRFPEMTFGPNKICLIEAQEKFFYTGASEERLLAHVRLPTSEDKLDILWRPIDLSLDQYEYIEPGKPKGDSYPDDSTKLYYWRKSK